IFSLSNILAALVLAVFFPMAVLLIWKLYLLNQLTTIVGLFLIVLVKQFFQRFSHCRILRRFVLLFQELIDIFFGRFRLAGFFAFLNSRQLLTVAAFTDEYLAVAFALHLQFLVAI